MPNRIICGGDALAVDADITIDHKLWFDPENPKHPCAKRSLEPSLAVLHHTGAENPVETFFANCLKRKVSAHFFVAADGHVHQLADIQDTTTFHAHSTGGVVNRRSIGIEIQSKGVAPVGKVPRGVIADIVRGKRVKALSFTADQIDAVVAVLECLRKANLIARKIPRDDKGVFINAFMSTKQLTTFSGVIGHLHVDGGTGKTDPGTQLFNILADEGW